MIWSVKEEEHELFGWSYLPQEKHIVGRASNSTCCTLPLIKTCEKSQQTQEVDPGYYHARKGSQRVKINRPWLNGDIVYKHYPRALSQSQVIIFPALESNKVITILDIHQAKRFRGPPKA
ncbi:hypothetical protein V6Z11_D07G131400 [Gossypium hirsutum]|uniref:Uncharacterized protein n=3 Tax=Gossypium TaxID=3633 RepID=A0A1U8P554_GOSHI|nr:uncharacterized protein LOC107954327 [Gossypium hirsutum]TYG61356.1 hypothetical protein ES288_D07G141200v1 [Gossypium darwinii]TYH62723.1 hypothetical protein ES332_D07G139800v1 [Gossypium tomentosum]